MADYASRRKALERRQKLIDAMIGGQQSQISPGQMVSGHYVPAGPLQALAGVGQGIAGALLQKSTDKETEALDQERASIMSEALKNAQSQSSGDKMNTLLNSGVPELQAMGMELFKASLSPAELKIYEGQLYNPQTGELGPKIPGKRNLKAHRGQLFDPETGETVGGPIGQAAPGTSVNVTNVMPAQETAYSKQVGKMVGDRTIDQLLVQREQTANNLNQVQKLKQIANEGMVSGRVAPLGVFMGQVMSSFGVPVPEGLANAERYDAAFQQPVTQMILAGGRGITNEEGERIAKTWAPLWSSAEGRMKILDDLEQLNRRKFKSIMDATEQLKTQRPDVYEMLQRDPAMQLTPPPENPTLQPQGPVIPGVTPQTLPPPSGAPRGKFIGWEN